MRKRLTKREREKVLMKYDRRCAYCGCSLVRFHVDHKHPVAAGGTCSIENLMPACARCNNYKHDRSLDQFRQDISEQVIRARKYSVNFRLAEKFGLIEIKEKPIQFWFEMCP